MRHIISLQGKNNEVETKGKNNRQGNKIKRGKMQGKEQELYWEIHTQQK